MKARGLQKSLLVNWEKFGTAAQALMNWEKLGSVHSPRPTFQNPNFQSMGELGKNMS